MKEFRGRVTMGHAVKIAERLVRAAAGTVLWVLVVSLVRRQIFFLTLIGLQPAYANSGAFLPQSYGGLVLLSIATFATLALSPKQGALAAVGRAIAGGIAVNFSLDAMIGVVHSQSANTSVFWIWLSWAAGAAFLAFVPWSVWRNAVAQKSADFESEANQIEKRVDRLV
jgi:hypothetical protein